MVQVLKANGATEAFSEEKVIHSIHRAGIPKALEDEVLEHVKSKLYDHISSSEIFHHIVEYLGKSPHPYNSARYSLKQAINLLGPTGYPFEDYIGEIFKAEGYQAETRLILQGKCISHEVDVVAKKNSETIMVEAKYHNTPGIRTDTHVALYTKARFEDLKEVHGFTNAWLVTNTKVTSDVEKYALCSGLTIMSWGYPNGRSLREIVEKYKLYPVTVLTTLNQAQKQTLLNNHVVLCKDLAEHTEKLDLLFLQTDEKEKILAEVSFVVQSPATM